MTLPKQPMWECLHDLLTLSPSVGIAMSLESVPWLNKSALYFTLQKRVKFAAHKFSFLISTKRNVGKVYWASPGEIHFQMRLKRDATSLLFIY